MNVLGAYSKLMTSHTRRLASSSQRRADVVAAMLKVLHLGPPIPTTFGNTGILKNQYRYTGIDTGIIMDVI